MTWSNLKLSFTVVAAVCIGWFVYQHQPILLVGSFLQLSPSILFVVVVLDISSVFLTAHKWRLLLPGYRFKTFVKANFVSQYYSLLPAGQLAGEGAKTYYFGRQTAHDWQATAVSVFVDKVTGLVGAVVIVGLVGTLLTSSLSAHTPLRLALISGLSFLLGVFFLACALLRWWPEMPLHLFSQTSKLPIKVKNWLLSSWRCGAYYINQPKVLGVSIGLGVACQILAITIVWLVAQDLGILISVFDLAWVLALLSLVLFVPLTLAGLGVREGTIVGLLSLLGVDPVKSLSLALILFVLQLILSAIGGAIQLNSLYSSNRHYR